MAIYRTVQHSSSQLSAMRFAVFIVVAVVAVVAVEAAPQRISTKYDNVDVDRIIGNGRILTSYIKCAMDEGPCTAEGRELKKHLPNAIKSNCSGCNEQQKKNANKLIAHMRATRKRDWDRLVKRFDPTGESTKATEKPSASTTTVAPSIKVTVAPSTTVTGLPSTKVTGPPSTTVGELAITSS